MGHVDILQAQEARIVAENAAVEAEQQAMQAAREELLARITSTHQALMAETEALKVYSSTQTTRSMRTLQNVPFPLHQCDVIHTERIADYVVAVSWTVLRLSVRCQ